MQEVRNAQQSIEPFADDENTHSLDLPLDELMTREEAALPSAQERMIASGAHLCSLLNFFLPIVLPTLVLLILENHFRESRFIARHVEQALAFEFFYFAMALSVAAALVGQIYCIPIAPFLILFGLYCNLRAARSAQRGEIFEYPLTAAFVKEKRR
jgi:uncharacterized Tic20 family protein